MAEEECIVSPVVEVKFSPLQKFWQKSEPDRPCILRIPHCVDRDEFLDHIRVTQHSRHNTSEIIRQLPQNQRFTPLKEGTFSVDEKFVRIVASNFSFFRCTSCKTVCPATVLMFLFGKFDREASSTSVDITAVLGSSLFSLQEFKNVSSRS